MSAGVECKTPEQYESFINTNLVYMKEKCSKLTDCIEKLYSDENVLSVIKGEDLTLNNTCGLVYRPENGNYTTLRGKCSNVEREEISLDLERNIQEQIDKNVATWKSVESCLKKLYPERRPTKVEEICLRARIRNEICNSTSTHRMVQSYFNSEIRNLQCRCKFLVNSGEMSVLKIAGIGVGCFVALMIIFLFIFCCYRRKQKLKRRKTNTSVVYVQNSLETPVYQEVFDDRPIKSNYQQSPPSLPSRYVQRTPLSQDDSGYLEPAMVSMKYRPTPPVPQQTSNPGYESPPRYSECDRDDLDSGYFQPISEPIKGATPFSDCMDPIREDGSARESLPCENAPMPTDTPLCPIPAKRTKKDDRQVESQYFLLEDGNSQMEQGSDALT